MTPPVFSLCMAHFHDWSGFYFTMLNLRQHHPVADFEFILLDNSSDSHPKTAKAIRDYGAKCPRFTYVAAQGLKGTTQTRQAAIDQAQGKYVIVNDCHIGYEVGAIAALRQYYQNNPETRDIISGPMIDDTCVNASTHFNPVWRSQMWGIWGCAWVCPCGRTTFSCVPGADGTVRYVTVDMTLRQPEVCPKCQTEYPHITPYEGHETPLYEHGFRMWHTQAKPQDTLDIPGMGLGSFSFRKDAWPGFNKACTGFGGEELTIHEKVRQNGGRAVCLRGFAWQHRFFRGNGDTDSPPYPIVTWHRVRNYAINFGDIKRPLGEIEGHFVHDTKSMPQENWNRLMQDPIAYNQDAAGTARNAPKYVDVGRPKPPAELTTFEQVLEWLAKQPRDLNNHLVALSKFASQVNHVTEFSGRRESAWALAAGCTGTVNIYNDESTDPLFERLHEINLTTGSTTGRRVRVWPSSSASLTAKIEPTQMLFLDTEHTADRLQRDLDNLAPQVSQWIAIHDTELFLHKGSDQGPGLGRVIEAFCEKNPEWFVMSHVKPQYGMTYLSRRPSDRPSRKIHLIAPSAGPGSELKEILKTLGVEENNACDCNAKMEEMNKMGVAGCRENIDRIKGWIYEGKERWKWNDGLSKGSLLNTLFKGVSTADGWSVGIRMFLGGNYTDPVPALIETAIARAEAKGLP